MTGRDPAQVLSGVLSGVLMCLVLTACGSGVGTASDQPTPAPTLDAPSAERIALAADDARRLAYARADPAPLDGLYTPALFAAATHHLAGLAQLGSAVEETPQQRGVVHFSAAPGRAEVVLSVRGVQRRSARGMPVRPWASFLRQWDMDLVWAGGQWLVDAEQDLPPDRWWK